MMLISVLAFNLGAGLAGGGTPPPGFSPLQFAGPVEHVRFSHPPAPGSQLLSSAAGQLWVIEPGLGRIAVLGSGGRLERHILLPWSATADAHPRAVLLAAYAAEGAWLWDASAGEGFHWRQGRWQGPFRLAGQVGALAALADGRVVLNTPAHPEGSFAVLTADGVLERRFGQAPSPPHPLLAPHYDSWVLLAVAGECVAANRYLPRLVRFRPDGSMVWQRLVAASGVDRLEASRRRALGNLREDCGSGCIDAELVEFATAGQGFADGSFVLNYSRRPRLDWFGSDGTWRGSVRLGMPADSSPQPAGLGFVGEELFLATAAEVLRLQPAAREGGRVVDERGEAVTGARVRLVGENHLEILLTTDEEGRFAPPAGWAPVTVVVEVTAEGFVPLRRTGILPELLSDDLVLERQPQVCFRVTDRSSGRPIGEFSAQLRHRREETERAALTPGSAMQSFASSDGRGCLASALPPPLELVVSAAGFASRRLRVAGGDELDIALAPEARLSLTVLTRQADPVAEANVSLYPAAVAAQPVRVGDVAGSTDATGRWQTTGLEVGRYLLEISHRDHPQRDEFITLIEGDNQLEVQVGAGTEVTFVVRDAEERAVEGVHIAVVPLEAGGSAKWLDCQTDHTGRCRVTGLLEGATRAVLAVPDGRQVARQLTVSGERMQVEVRLPGGGRVEGRLEGIEHYPELSLEVVATRGDWTAWVAAGGDGSFTLNAVPPGRVLFRVTGGDQSPAALVQAARDVGEGVTFVELQLPQPLRVSGVVRRGERVCGACQLLFAPSTGPRSRIAVACQGGGRYRAHLPLGGDYTVIISDPDTGERWVRTLAIQRDTTWDVDLEGATVEGVVVERGSQVPVAGALVRLLAAAGGLLADQRSRDDGSFRFSNLGAGQLRLVAEAEGRLAERNLNVGGGAHHEILELAPRPLLRLRLAGGQTGRAIHGVARGSIIDPRGEWRPFEVLTTAEGEVAIPATHTGEHTVVVHAPPLAVTTVSLSPGGQPTPVLLWPPAVVQVEGVGSETLQVQFLAPSGRPQALTASPPSFAAAGRGVVRAQVPPGAATVVVELPDRRAVHRFPLTLLPEEQRVLALPR